MSIFVDSIINSDSINVSKLKKICDNHNVISFDIFDTLIKRNLKNPEDIFEILEEYGRKYLGIKNFSAIRRDTARYMFRNVPFVNLHGIYREIEKRINNKLVYKLEEKEIELEFLLVTPNYEIQQLYNYCRSKNKKIIAISDMYLEKNIINKMLQKCGYNIKDLFVSCDMKGNKINGTLFKKIRNELCISNKTRWLHIGDSIRGDFFGAIKSGLHVYHIPRHIYHVNDKKYRNKISDNKNYEIFYNLINNNIPYQKNYYQKFGYAIVGLLVFNYTKWLIDKLKKNDIKTVFFLSRDGFILKEVFDMLNNYDIKSKYLYVSRRAIRIPYAAFYNSFEDIISILPPTKLYTMKQFFDILGLEAEKYINICMKYGFDLNTYVSLSDIKNKKCFRDIYSEIYGDFVKNANIEYANFRQYLKQEEFEGRVAIVDIGWNNSMQFFIENLPVMDENKLNIYGYYIGVHPNARKVLNSEGFISDLKNGTDVSSGMGFVGLLESVFLSQEGSVKSYKKFGKQIIPELLPYEYKNNDKELEAFRYIQKGIINFVKSAMQIDETIYSVLNGYDAFLPFKEFGLNPYLKDIVMFEDFKYLSEGVFYFAKTEPFLYYLTHIGKLKKDLYNARWKIGFLKKVFKINLPYYSIYLKLRKKA